MLQLDLMQQDIMMIVILMDGNEKAELSNIYLFYPHRAVVYTTAQKLRSF